jgi:tetratricopeptide (TPR) repeat protein
VTNLLLRNLLLLLVLFTPARLPSLFSHHAVPAGQPTAFARGVALQQRGDLKGARQAYLDALKLSPKRVDANANLGQVYAGLGDYAAAVKHYRQALAVRPNLTEVRHQLAIAYFQAQRLDSAERELEQVVAAQSENLRARQLLGVTRLKLNKTTQGISDLETVLSAQPENLEAAYTLASACIKSGRIERARSLVEGPLKNISTAESFLVRGTFYSREEDYSRAVEELTRAREINPRLPSLLSELGYAWLLKGEKEKALPCFIDELSLNPDDFSANAFAGWLLRESGQLPQAQLRLKKALTIKPDDPGVLFQMAQLAKSRDAYAEAAELLERVITLRPNFTQGHVLLAQTYYRLKRSLDTERERAIIDRLNIEEQQKQTTARERLERDTGFARFP